MAINDPGRGLDDRQVDDDPLWYKDAIIYELHVRAFYDSNGDGIGDFRGLIEKLDYLKDLGVTCIWLLPFFPSPLKDDGYDIADYHDVHPTMGTLVDFETFVVEAHRRGLRVMTELVMNHTSDQHPWFQSARSSKDSPYRDYYVWTDTDDKYPDAADHLHRHRALELDLGPRGRPVLLAPLLQPPAGPELRQPRRPPRDDREPALLARSRRGRHPAGRGAVPVRARGHQRREPARDPRVPEGGPRRRSTRNYQGRILLAEANQWPADVRAYFGDDDECHMAFHFPLMPRIFMAIRREERKPIVEILAQTPDLPPKSQWAIFLRNHDELTLEMVTDEERDYMYREYARDPLMRMNVGIRRRLAPLMENGRRQIELLNGLLLSMPGTPVIYYGDEIGMGDNIFLGDRNGVRTPMQWSIDRNAGFSRADAARLYSPVIVDPVYGYQGVNVEAQLRTPTSLLQWMRRIIHIRKRYKAFGRGTIEFLDPTNQRILAYLREYEGEHLLIVNNLSRFAQPVELDLSEFDGWTPVELFGETPFPRIGELPYMLSFGPHGFMWFRLVPPEGERGPVTATERDGGLGIRAALPSVAARLPGFLPAQRWFGGKERAVERVEIRDTAIVPDHPTALLAVVDVFTGDAEPTPYFLPLGLADPALAEVPGEIVARHGDLVVRDAIADPETCRALLRGMLDGRTLPTALGGRFIFQPVRRQAGGPAHDGGDVESMAIRHAGVEQSNSSVIFGTAFILKALRRLAAGTNPEIEIPRFLGEHTTFDRVPALVGWAEYCAPDGSSAPVAVLQRFVPNQGDGWSYVLRQRRLRRRTLGRTRS